MPNIRCFIALPTSAEIQSSVAALIADLRRVPCDVRWQDASKLHLTLKFVGSVEADVVAEIGKQLSAISRYHPAFEMICEGTGGFPSLDRPRVLWVGLRQTDALARLHKDVETVALDCGIERETKPFHPHLTIARVREQKNLHRLTAKLKTLTLHPVSTRCTQMLVMRSDLHPEGSRYTVVQSIPLSL